ncbi:MAG: hypothetical protein RIM99_00235 [Cyclobacteriaceae bacterium]
MKNHLFTLFILTLLLSLSVQGQKNKQSVQLPEIADEIKKMRDEDQKMRIKWSGMVRKGKTETEKFKEMTKASIAKDRANTARMREIIAEHGWPTYDLVGEGPSNNAWLIIQHADRNPLFQAKCLLLLKAAVDKGQANPSNYAYLYDRVQVATGEKQLYATQSTSNNGLTEGYFQAIEDESNVQKRREAMGIDRSVEEYAESMGFTYTIPTPEEAKQRAEQLASDYQSNLAIATKAMADKNYTKAADAYRMVANANGLVTTEDFIEAARALSLAKHPEAKEGTRYLTRAMARGWDRFDQIKDHPDFTWLREVSASNWVDFLITADQMKLDK